MKKLYIPVNDLPFAGDVLSTINKLGIRTSIKLDPNTICLPMSDISAFAESEKGNYIDKEKILFLFDNIDMSFLEELSNNKIKVMPTKLATSKENLNAFGNIPLFVKRRRTIQKDHSKFSRTKWNNPSDLISEGILEVEENEILGEYVIQPQVEYPIKELHIHVATNSESEIKIFWSYDTQSNIIDKRQLVVSPSTNITNDIIEGLQTIYNKLAIKNTIHCVDFIWYNGNWHLTDWNLRPTTPFHKSVYGFDFIPEAGLSHIFDLTYPEIPEYYSEHRSFFDEPPNKIQIEIARKHLLTPRYDSKGVCEKLVGHGPSKEEVYKRFSLYESEL